MTHDYEDGQDCPNCDNGTVRVSSVTGTAQCGSCDLFKQDYNDPNGRHRHYGSMY